MKRPLEREGQDSVSFIEGVGWVRFYVRYFWASGKFYSLKTDMEEEDVVQEVMWKCARHRHFEKYDKSKNSVKYHISIAVRTTMIDLLRRQRIVWRDRVWGDATLSDTSNSATIVESVPDGGLSHGYRMASLESVSEFFETLSDEAVMEEEGLSPVMGRCFLSERMVCIHLFLGFNVDDIRGWFGVSRSPILKIQKELQGLARGSFPERMGRSLQARE